MTRFDFEPLARLVAQQYRGTTSSSDIQISDIGRAARLLGVERNTVYRWQRNGLNHLQSDRAACALGMHPVEIWADWIDEPAEPALCVKPSHGAIKRHRANEEPLCLDCAEFYAGYLRDWRARNPEKEAARRQRGNANRRDQHRNAARNARMENRRIA